MKLEDYIKLLQNAVKDNPTLADLEVWNFTDDEGNSILPMYEGIDSAFVEKDVYSETDEYVQSDELKDHLEYLEIALEDFNKTHKQIILL